VKELRLRPARLSKKGLRMRIGPKLVLGFAGVALLTGAVGFVSVNISKNALQKSIGENSVSLATDVLDKIDTGIYRRIEELQICSVDTEVIEAAKESNIKFERLEDIDDYIEEKEAEWTSVPKEIITAFMWELMDSKVSQELRNLAGHFEDEYGYKVFGEIFLTNKYGANIALTGKTTDYYQADERWWQAAKEDGLYVSDVEYDQSSNVYSLTIGVGVNDERRDFLGAIKAVLNIEDAFNIIKQSKKLLVYETVKLKLFDKKGRVIFDESEQMGFMDKFPRMQMFENISKKSGYILIRRKPDENEQLFVYVNSRGYRDYRGLGWVLTADYEAKEIFAPVAKLRNAVLFVTIVMVASAVLIGVFVSRSISKPITRLKNGADDISKGTLNTKIEIDSSDEVGELAQSFNRMAENLAEDMARRRKAEEKLRDYHAKLKSLAKASWLTEERERRRIAHGLHDDIGQKLAMAKLDLLSSLQGDVNAETAERIKTICSEIETVIESVRSFTFELSNPVLTELGLEAAIERHLTAEIGNKHGIKFELNKCGQLARLDEDMGMCLFRSTRELLNNIVKHAHAKKVAVSIDKNEGNIIITVSDDGVGFDPLVTSSKMDDKGGFGLFSIREQVENFSGQLKIESEPGRGSKFTIIMPQPVRQDKV
jgi:signal transduction histidine kinase